MKSKNIADAIDMLDDDILLHTAELRMKIKKLKRVRIIKYAAAACLCIICIAGIGLYGGTDEFVTIASLLDESRVSSEEHIYTDTIEIGDYRCMYNKVNSALTSKLEESIGRAFDSSDKWYYVSGHKDAQYLIQRESAGYSLWEFACFDSSGYSYSDVMQSVYGIDSADKIAEIRVRPSDAENTDYGKKLHESRGEFTVKDRKDIETVYRCLMSLECYGDDNWDMIEYRGSDDEACSGDAVKLGRYITIVTDDGNEIDRLKYTAVSDMFYEYGGIAYSRLTDKQAEDMRRILKITDK